MTDSQAPMGPSAELRAKREALLGTHLRGETEMNSEMVLDTMTDPPTYELSSIGVVLRGRDQVRQLLEVMFAAMPGIVHRPVVFHHADEDVVVEVETDFPNGMDGSTPGQVATVKTIGVFPFDGEVSLGEKVYGDMSALVPHLTFLDQSEGATR